MFFSFSLYYCISNNLSFIMPYILPCPIFPHSNLPKLLVAQSCLALCDPMDSTQQVPLSMGFSRQEYLSGLPFPSPVDLPGSGIEPRFAALQAIFTL